MMRSFSPLCRVFALACALSTPCVLQAANWYLHDPQAGNWNTLTEWWSLPEGGVNPGAMSGSDDYFSAGMQLRTPATSVAETFPGRSLTLNGGGINNKASTSSPGITIGNLNVYAGTLGNGVGGTQIVNVTTLAAFGPFSLNTWGATRNIDLRVTNLTGKGDLNMHGGGAVYITLTNATQYYGRMIVASGAWNSTTSAAEPTQAVFQNALVSRGPLIVESGNSVILNATITVTGLTVNGVVKATGTHTAASLGFTGSGSIINTAPAPWYLHASSPLGQSWNTVGNWWSAPTGGTAATAISSNDNYFTNGFQLRSPENYNSEAFPGASLTINGGSVLVKAKSTSTTTSFTNVIVSGSTGAISNGVSGVQIIRMADLSVASTFNIDTVANNRGFNMTIDRLSGAGTVAFLGHGGGTLLLTVTNASNFTGTINLAASNSGTLTFQNDLFTGGSLVVNTGHSVVLNQSITVAGLTVAGVVKAAGTYTAAQLGAQFSGTGIVTVRNRPQQMFGVNASGLEFSTALRPKDEALVYDSDKGLTLVRVPFLWERVLDSNGNLITGANTSIAYLDSILAKAEAEGLKVILDMHNYGKHNGIIIGQTGSPYSDYQAAWATLAAHFNSLSTAHVIWAYDIMNEPNGSTIDWPTAAQYGVNGVRQSDTTRFILIEGDAYSSAKDWPNINDGLLGVTDSQKKLIYSAHCYFANTNNDGYVPYDQEGAFPDKGVDLVAPFVEWCKRNKVHGHIGEYGVPDTDARWNTVLQNFLQYLRDNDVSGTYWSGGGRWSASYELSMDPSQWTTPPNPAYDSLQMGALGLFVQ